MSELIKITEQMVIDLYCQGCDLYDPENNIEHPCVEFERCKKAINESGKYQIVEKKTKIDEAREYVEKVRSDSSFIARNKIHSSNVNGVVKFHINKVTQLYEEALQEKQEQHEKEVSDLIIKNSTKFKIDDNLIDDIKSWTNNYEKISGIITHASDAHAYSIFYKISKLLGIK